MKRILIILAAMVVLPVWAEQIGLPADMPISYKNECGSCHTPFPPALLTAADWNRTMAGLSQHFGTDASLDAKISDEISAWLQRNAGQLTSAASAEPRLTTTAWFKRKHRELPTQVWQDSRVKSAANCSACHAGADQGRYGEPEINILGIGPYHDED